MSIGRSLPAVINQMQSHHRHYSRCDQSPDMRPKYCVLWQSERVVTTIQVKRVEMPLPMLPISLLSLEYKECSLK